MLVPGCSGPKMWLLLPIAMLCSTWVPRSCTRSCRGQAEKQTMLPSIIPNLLGNNLIFLFSKQKQNRFVFQIPFFRKIFNIFKQQFVRKHLIRTQNQLALSTHFFRRTLTSTTISQRNFVLIAC